MELKLEGTNKNSNLHSADVADALRVIVKVTDN